MADTSIDPAVLAKAIKQIIPALESLEMSMRSGARFRAGDLKNMMDALKELLSDLEKGE